MKRFLAVVLAAAMLVSCFAMTSFAATSSKDEVVVKTVSFSIDTSGIEPGMDPDDVDRAVSIESTDSGEPWTVSVGQIECTSPTKTLKIGDNVKITFYADLRSKSYIDYYFSSSSKARVSAEGDIKVQSTTSHRDDAYCLKVTVTLKPLKGTYSEPENLEWKSGYGQAKWSKPEDGNGSGSYDIRLKRDDKTVVEFACVSGTTMNFYPWMEKEGDYTFEVRTVPNETKSVGKKSEWVQSDSQYIDKNHVSDGSGKFDPSGTGGGGEDPSNPGKVGWVQSGNTWYYRYPDGAYKKNGWEKIQGKWYYFDASGAMKTGWVTVNGQVYYLDAANGDMKTGWVKTSDGQWYFLITDPNSSIQGAMVKDQWIVDNNKTYYMKSTGAMATGWLKIGEDYYYFNPTQNADYGAMVRNQRIDSFYVGADGKWVRGA
ncbi:MAG: N-acetylmuramoyl-L-alanine amidase family protein [Lachnospiraceae bacterium]|nr:N-acetylmuramoyl-L-alanine amidase family protein [Lachnospiraceae bacterium]